jgi:hypothetical protein
MNMDDIPTAIKAKMDEAKDPVLGTGALAYKVVRMQEAKDAPESKPKELTIDLDKKTSELTKPKFDWLYVQIALFVTLPPLLTGLIEYLTGWELPPYVRDAIFILIFCIESVIFFFTAQLVFLMRAGQNIYKEIVKLGNDIKQPLETIGKIFFDMKDLLPLVAELLSKVDKKWIQKELKKLISMVNAGNIDRDKLHEYAELMTQEAPKEDKPKVDADVTNKN